MTQIRLQITDQITGKDTIVSLSMHDAQKLYQSLRELIGDVQYQTAPGQLITMPPAHIKIR
jgi:hypothetical protein